MLIQVQKFGTTLSSRPAGKEAFAAFQPTLRELEDHEEIIIDFDGVLVMGPSWADEFLTPMKERYGERVSLKNTENPSVQATLDLLEEVNKGGFSQ